MFDKNKDNTISKEEFTEIFKDFIKKELGNINNLISDLRREFKKADVSN
jgi:Ca2+-binding EF-hand superfamily protein